MATMMTAANPVYKVIVFSPFYENYGADAILSGAESIYVLLYPPEFNFNADELEAAFKQHPKAIIPSSSPTRCTSILCMSLTNIFISPLCRVCGKG